MFFKVNAKSSDARWRNVHGTAKGIFLTRLKTLMTSFPRRCHAKDLILCMKSCGWILMLLIFLLMVKMMRPSHVILFKLIHCCSRCLAISGFKWISLFTCPSAPQQTITTLCFTLILFDVRVLYFTASSLPSFIRPHISWDCWQGGVWNKNPIVLPVTTFPRRLTYYVATRDGLFFIQLTKYPDSLC